jgi:acyl-CoA synthetase (NDP forming)
MTPTAGSAGFERMLHARSVALVGVSGRAASLSARPLAYLIEGSFAGKIYPVNPGRESLHGLTCYPSLSAVPGPVDLVLISLPARDAIATVREAGEAGAAGVIVFASGFAETGRDGVRLQAELRAAGSLSGVRILGPNCQGLYYGPTGLAATFTAAASRPFRADSGVAYVGQSGAVGGSVFDLATEMGVGLTAWVSTGNQADLDVAEIATVLLDDPAVRVVMLYVESITDGAAFTRLCRRASSAGKRLVMLISGTSAAGRRAVASHTGSMLDSGIAAVLTATMHGVILADDIDELVAVAAASSAPAAMGRRVGVITTSGGAGSLMADHCARSGLSLPELNAGTRHRLDPLVPSFGSVANPVDLTAEILNSGRPDEAISEVCRIVAADPDVDILAVVLTMVTGPTAAALARGLVTAARRPGAPLFVAWLAGHDQTRDGRSVFRAAGLPVFKSVGDMARVAGLLARAGEAQTPPPEAPGSPRPDRSETAELLRSCASGQLSGIGLLSVLGIPQPRATLATSAEEAAAAAAAAAGPWALKLQASSVAHKSELGAVRLNIAAGQVPGTFAELMLVAAEQGLREVEGVLVQEMIPAGLELIVGLACGRDGFPPVITVGMGGITTEIYQDVVSALAPVRADRALTMLRRLRGWPLLDGFRGAAAVDVTAAAAVVEQVSRLGEAAGQIECELEINPLIVAARGRGVSAVDVLVKLGDASTS